MIRRDRKALIMTLGAASALLAPMSLVAPAHVAAAPAHVSGAPARVSAAPAHVLAAGADGSAGGAEGSTVSSHWLVQSSAIATEPGADISTPGFDATGWLPETTDDAGGGLTEIGALTQNGQRAPGAQDSTCSTGSIFFSHNMLNCFGQGSVRGAPTNQPFTVPWWFRTDFPTPSGFNAHRNAQLIINGVVGQADVWVNGTEVATQQTVMGDYAQYTFDIGQLLSPPGQPNSLALEVSPNNPRTMFTLDTVDWNQPAPDNNTGIQFPVQIDYYGALQLSNAHVTQDNASDMSSSSLTVKGDVTNSTDSSQ
jgi:exo-1,4-beta-D-glucosaminidase